MPINVLECLETGKQHPVLENFSLFVGLNSTTQGRRRVKFFTAKNISIGRSVSPVIVVSALCDDVTLYCDTKGVG